MKSLIIYFSRADENYAVGVVEKGNTEIVAEYLSELTGADMFKVEREVPYSKDYKNCCNEAKIEQENNERPKLKNYLKNIDEYDIIYIGSPIYWGTMPAPLFTQLEMLNFEGKTIYPFTTHEGSGLGNVANDIRRICIGANVEEGLSIKGSEAKNSKDKIIDWLDL